MSGPDGFRNRVATDVVPVAQRDPAAFQSGVAQGLEEIGRAGEQAVQTDAEAKARIAASQNRMNELALRRQQSAQIAEGAGRWAEVEAQLDTDREALRDGSAPGAPDHAEKAGGLITERLKGFYDSLPDDPEVRQRFAPIIGQYGATARREELKWGTVSRTKFEGQNIDKWADSTGNALLSAPDPEKLQHAFEATDLLVGALDIPGTTRDALIQEKKRGFSKAFLDGRLAAGDWKGTRALLDSGQFDALLDPKEKANYLQRAGVAEDQAAREVELRNSQVRDDARDQVAALEAKVDAGVVPDAATVRTVRTQAERAQLDPQELVKLDALDVKVGVNRSYGALIGQPGGADRIRRDRDALAAKMLAGKASEADQMAKAQMDKLVDHADTQEAETFKAIAAQGPAGKLQVLGMLTGTPEGRYDKAEKIEPGLGYLSMLASKAREAAISGAALREGRKDDFGKEEDIRRQVNAMLGPVASEIGSYSQVVKGAGDIMASLRVIHGGVGIDPNDLKAGLKLATGGSIRSDGRVQGGLGTVRGHPVLLPDWLTDIEFDTAVSRQNFASAVSRSGKELSKEDILANTRPKFAGDDALGNSRYHFVAADGSLLIDKGGSAIVLTFVKP